MSQRKTHSKDFKLKMVKLRKSGMSRKEIIQEYDLKYQTFDSWLAEYW